MSHILVHLLSNIFLLAGIILFDKEFTLKGKETKILALYIISSNLIDVDHLFATPIYDPTRCSINFHPLHSWYLFPIYILGLLWNNKNIRYLSLAILLHLWLDFISCVLL